MVEKRAMRREASGARGTSLLPTTSYTYEIIYYLDGELSGAGIESPRPWRNETGRGGSVRDGTRYT